MVLQQEANKVRGEQQAAIVKLEAQLRSAQV